LIKIEKNNIGNEIKSYIVRSGKKMTEIVDIINRDKDEKDKTSLQNLSNKLRRGSLRYDEILEIAEACGYEIAWMRKE